ncbi:MAG TPA: hypothetical protein VFA47_13985 [Candidatus Manganitrophaceae bacterium]|nr:hypothetical protein [Candidatus Manganitrophaceae bacterium]
MKKRSLWLAGAIAVLLISGCGGSSDDHPPGSAPATSAASDPFTRTVREMVATDPENTEPVSIAKIEVTSSEKAEPESL